MNATIKPVYTPDAESGVQGGTGAQSAPAASAPSSLAPDLRRQVDSACAATDATLALEGLARLESEAALAEVAQHARISEIRFAAAQRITDPDLLARLVEVTRHRDNRVYRHCSDLLRMRRRTLGHAMRAAELAAAFRGLLAARSDRLALPADRFDELEMELNRLRQECDVEQECLDLAAAVREQVRAEVQAMRALGSDAAQAEALCAQIAAGARNADAGVFQAKLAEIAERASRRVAWLAGHPTAAALAHSIERARSMLDVLRPAPPAAAPVSIAPATEPVRIAPATRKANAIPAGERDAMRELLERLALQLQSGHIAEAEETERRISERSDAGSLPASMARRLRRDRAQLARMRDWARWGNDQAREHLIRNAEALLEGERDAEALAAAVTGLREEWKRLDAKRHADRSQWERFDAVLTQAFRPVLEIRAKRASEEKAAALAKETLCDRCEAWAATIDWQHADWRSIAVQRHEFGTQWRLLPFAGFRGERKLRKRFDKPLKIIDERLGAARQAEIGRREALVREAEALRESQQLGEAIKAAVALQARWKEGALDVALARRDEQALWQRFRSACDALFARRDAQRSERETLRERHLNERKALLAGLESALAASDAAAVARALAEFRRAWGGAQRNSRDKGDPLEARARELLRRAERGIAELQLRAVRSRFEWLARRSTLVERLEAAAAGGEGIPEALALEVEQEWQALPALAAKEGSAMQARLAAAAQARAATFEKGRLERETLLLELELALDLPSPASAAAARRERQLLRLRERFRPGHAQSPDPEGLVLRWYATAARSEPQHDARMAAIVEALVKSGR